MNECEQNDFVLRAYLGILRARSEAEINIADRIEQLEQELQTERETTQQALQTSQEWHERQKREITEAKDQIIEELKSEIDRKEQANQNYLACIQELEEQIALLQQELETEKEIQEITTNLENQTLEENSERQLETELTTQIIQSPNHGQIK